MENKERVKKKIAQELTHKLEFLMMEERLYRDNNLSLRLLAEQLGNTTNNVSWILNTTLEKSFYDYINEYRVQEFIQRIEAGEHRNKTFLSIAMEVGFNSKSTFNKVFKSITNYTPSNYIKNWVLSTHPHLEC